MVDRGILVMVDGCIFEAKKLLGKHGGPSKPAGPEEFEDYS
jgi:hypothetical protein